VRRVDGEVLLAALRQASAHLDDIVVRRAALDAGLPESPIAQPPDLKP
jgi:hypothetical protein